MKVETQALHLASMMKNYIDSIEYELALPLVMVRSSKLKNLRIDDVLLLELMVLEFVLIDGETICAKLVLKYVNESYILEITKVYSESICPTNSKKYETIKLSLGLCNIENLVVGKHLAMAQFSLEKVTLLLNDTNIAVGSLVTSDQKIAVKINKVMQ